MTARQPAIGSALGLTAQEAVGDGSRVVALRKQRDDLRVAIHRAIDRLADREPAIDVTLQLRRELDRILGIKPWDS